RRWSPRSRSVTRARRSRSRRSGFPARRDPSIGTRTMASAPDSTDASMRACWIEEWGGPLQSGARVRPQPASGEVLIEVEACGVGLTVLNCMRGDLARGIAKTPRVPGHELVGRIVATGAGVAQDRAGERVMAFFYLFCGTCRRCVAGCESLC